MLDDHRLQLPDLGAHLIDPLLLFGGDLSHLLLDLVLLAPKDLGMSTGAQFNLSLLHTGVVLSLRMCNQPRSSHAVLLA